jgi:hypothetical protein
MSGSTTSTSEKFQIGSITTSLGICGEGGSRTVLLHTGHAAERPPDLSFDTEFMFEAAEAIATESAARMLATCAKK